MNECLPAIVFALALIFLAIGVMVVYMLFTEDTELLVSDVKTFKEMMEE